MIRKDHCVQAQAPTLRIWASPVHRLTERRAHACNRKPLSALTNPKLVDLGETSGRKPGKTSERRGTASVPRDALQVR
jgi:hypothetical protein